MKLGVPLQTQYIGFAFQAYGFNQAIFGTFRLDAQPLAQGLDSLVVNGNNLPASRFRIELAQTAALLPHNGVGMSVIIIVNMNIRQVILGGNILIQGPAHRHIDQLGSPANAEHGSARLHELMQQLHFVGIAQPITSVHVPMAASLLGVDTSSVPLGPT